MMEKITDVGDLMPYLQLKAAEVDCVLLEWDITDTDEEGYTHMNIWVKASGEGDE
jgi:hypothetical protein